MPLSKEPEMTPERWEEIANLFEETRQIPTAERADFLKSRSALDPELASEVAHLLAQNDSADGFLDTTLISPENLAKLPVWQIFEPGQELAGRFRVVRFLARGGMGEVYEAFDQNLDLAVALKTISADLSKNPTVLNQFVKEVQLARSVTHPNVCRVHDLFRDESQDCHFLVMELIAGETLAKRIEREGPFSPPAAAAVLKQIAEALDAAHKVDVIHRDLKPSNVILANDKDGGIRAVVTDFGIAATGGRGMFAAGTPDYMAPEQCGTQDVTAACDIYSFGVLAHELVSGVRPVTAEGNAEPPGLAAELPARWKSPILRCLDPDPTRRFSNALDFIREIEGKNGLLTRRNLLLSLAGSTVAATGLLIERYRKPSSLAEAALSLAILPFSAADHDLDVIAQGLSGDLQRVLATSPLLHVIGETSSQAAAIESPSWAVAAQRLKVDHVLTGVLSQSGTDVSVDTRIHRALDKSVEWQQVYRSSKQRVAQLPTVIARSIAGALSVRLAPEQVTPSPQVVSTAAYEEYLLGRAAALERSEKSLSASIGHYEEAIRRAPNFAVAYAAMAISYNIVAGSSSRFPLESSFQSARAAAVRALSIAPGLGEANLVLGSVAQRRDWDWEAAARYYRLALAGEPGMAMVHQWRSGLLSILREPRQAVDEAKTACDLEPLAIPPKAAYAGMLQRARRYSDAVHQLKLILQLKPDYQGAWNGLGSVYLLQGELDASIRAHNEAVRQSHGAPAYLAGLAHALAKAARRKEAQGILHTLETRWPNERFYPWALVEANQGLGNFNEAYRWALIAYQMRDPNLTVLVADPINESLRADARFEWFSKQLKL
jgi:serine/threonine protein kinase/tetratricopeptide (TPR) repeat protein